MIGPKYAVLTAYFQALSESDTDIAMDDIERMVELLPSEARRNRAWWTNRVTQPQATAWLAASWEVTHVSVPRQTVRFRRMSTGN